MCEREYFSLLSVGRTLTGIGCVQERLSAWLLALFLWALVLVLL